MIRVNRRSDDIQIFLAIKELDKLIGTDVSSACLEERAVLIEAMLQEYLALPPRKAKGGAGETTNKAKNNRSRRKVWAKG